LTYAEFIEEIRRLVTQGDSILADRHDRESRTFRNWRHSIQNTVSHAKDIGLNLPGTFSSSVRMYRANWAHATAHDNWQAFERDTGDTLAELRFLIDQFDRFGPPKSIAVADGAKLSLAAPEKVTARWLLDNVSVAMWAAGGAILVTVFLAGVTAAQVPIVRTIIEAFRR
jgi:hypothetical protein